MRADEILPGDQDTRPEAQPKDRGTVTPILIGSTVATLGVLGLFAAWSQLTFGNVVDGIASLGGQAIQVRETVIDLGSLSVDETVTADIRLTNLTGEPINIIGADTGCSCAVTSGLPMTLPPRSTETMQVYLTPGQYEAGLEIERRIEIFADVTTDPMWVVLKGFVGTSDASMESRNPN